MHPVDSIVVFTTPERYDLFRAALGDGADFRVDPRGSVPLDAALENVRAGAGQLAVIDEDHFMDGDDFVEGLRAYLDKPGNDNGRLRFIVVCSERRPGDGRLAFLAGYLGIYDIVCDCQGADVVNAVSALAARPNGRADVLGLLAPWRAGVPQGADAPRSPSAPARAGAPGTCEVKLSVQVLPGRGPHENEAGSSFSRDGSTVMRWS